MRDELNYRMLPQTEADWQRLRGFFHGTPGFLPPTHLGMAAVAETKDNEIVGSVVLQLLSYMGPFKIREDHQGKVDYITLKSLIDGSFEHKGKSALIIPGYVAMTGDERVAKLAQFAGMKRIGPIVLIEEFDPQENGIPIL